MKKIIFLIIFGLFLAGCAASNNTNDDNNTNQSPDPTNPEDYELTTTANNEFAFELYHQLNSLEVDEQNIFISPTSIYLALSMVLNGADGDTKNEMAEVLHVDLKDLESINESNNAFLHAVNQKDFKAELEIGNSLWIKEGYPFLQSYMDRVTKYFLADLFEVDFTQEKTKDELNRWVSEKTNGKIKEMVSQIRPDTVAYLFNTIYFKGSWEQPFDPERTIQDTFFGDKVTDKHPFMVQDGKYNYYENDVFQLVELPYEEQKLSMYVILPKETHTLADLYEQLTVENWNKWHQEQNYLDGTISLPKFELEYEANLNDVLISLGMPLAFSNQADFSQMVENGGVRIDEVKHKSTITVDEKGTEAAAATSVAIVEMAALEQFTMNVNRPFFFIIQDNESGMIMFMGEVKSV